MTMHERWAVRSMRAEPYKQRFGVFVDEQLAASFCQDRDGSWLTYAPGMYGVTPAGTYLTRRAARTKALELSGIPTAKVPDVFRRA